MSFPHSLSMPELGFTSSMEVYQFSSRHYNIQLRSSKPTSKKHRFQHYGSEGNGANLCELQLWSHNSQVFAHGCSLQMGTMRPRSRKLKVLSFGHGKSSLLNEYKLDRRHGGVQLGLDEVNSTNLSFVVRSSSTLSVATQLAVKGAKILVLEKYVILGGSSFDVGSSVMFSFSDKGNLNLITQALAAVGCEMPVIPDPTTVHYHLPDNLSVLVHREYSEFISERTSKFPHEKQGILKFYGVCWKVFNASNSLELKSLEEPIYHFGQFFQKPVECLTLAYYLPQNAGDIACKYIQDPQLLSFIDAECFIVITVKALQTPMINASMVMCDRHYGGINYPIGGVGGIAKSLAKGLVDQGSQILYKANVTNIIVDPGRVVGVRLSDGREFFAKTIISNATRWNTFGKLIKGD
ncbi:hypothetical protein ACFX15_008396 [Malus domestica]